MTGTELRIGEDYFPFASSIMEVRWKPGIGEFTMAETDIAIGQSSGRMSGIFKLGLDEQYGPTVSMAMTGHQVSIHPNDMEAPETPFSELSFSGWSAPLYGALGCRNHDNGKIVPGEATERPAFEFKGQRNPALIFSGIPLPGQSSFVPRVLNACGKVLRWAWRSPESGLT